MDLLNKNHISNTILITGLISYVFYICVMQFVSATIIMSATLLAWIAFNAYFDIIDKHFLIKILSISGFILSISIFFVFGIEELPFPVGAIIFHGYGISIALLMFLLSLIPILLMNSYISETNYQSTPALDVNDTKQNNNIDLNDNWEEITDEEVDWEKFETAS